MFQTPAALRCVLRTLKARVTSRLREGVPGPPFRFQGPARCLAPRRDPITLFFFFLYKAESVGPGRKLRFVEGLRSARGLVHVVGETKVAGEGEERGPETGGGRANGFSRELCWDVRCLGSGEAAEGEGPACAPSLPPSQCSQHLVSERMNECDGGCVRSGRQAL